MPLHLLSVVVALMQFFPLMKKVFTIILILFSIKSFACDCDSPEITKKFTESDFVAKAKIVKVYKNQDEEEIYKADILIDELFKGESLKSIYVYGRSDGEIGSSCAIYIPENTELIIYARKDRKGLYGIGMCSGLLYLGSKNPKRKEKEKRELEILKTFKENNINFTDRIHYQNKGDLHGSLEKYKVIELDENFAIFELIFDADLTIKEVKKISGFNQQIDTELIETLKKSKWTSYQQGVRDSVPENSRLLIGIYFYPAEKGNESFLSNYYH